MNKIAIAFLAATALASFGCKKKGGAGEAMEMMKKYKADLCACKDHDVDCGKKATDAYQKSMADWTTKNAGEKADTKPDPEMEKLTTEVADCSKRVMTPDMGAAGGAAGGAAAAPPAGGAAAGSDTAAGGAAPAAGGSDTAAPAAGAPPAGGAADQAGSGSAAK